MNKEYIRKNSKFFKNFNINVMLYNKNTIIIVIE